MEILFGLLAFLLIAGVIIMLILGVMFVAGLILLVVGIVGWIHSKKAGVKKVYPKVLILVSLPLLIVPSISVGPPVMEAIIQSRTNQTYVSETSDYASYDYLY